MKTRYFTHLLVFASLLLASWAPFQVGSLTAQDPATPEPNQPVDQGWLETVQRQLESSEYNITWQDETPLLDLPSAYQAPNRQQGFRAYFTPLGLTLVPRTDTADWRLDLGSPGLEPYELEVAANRIDYRRADLQEWFENSPHGLLLGYTFSQPAGDSLLQVELSVGGSLSPALAAAGGQVVFSTAGGQPVLEYGRLVALDAAGSALPAHLELHEASSLRLSVEAGAATFPVRLAAVLTGLLPQVPSEPAALPSSPSWSAQGNQYQSWFGWSASTAGDLNGDGYSEFMVGAYGYDNGETNEGKVFVYFGSASGLDTTPGWTAENNQADAILGYFLAPAGDVNGDGYYDLLLGAHGYDNPTTNEGKIFLWYGSAAGLGADGTPANADWSYESNVEGNLLGVSDGMAGDVNRDGYGDLLVGMYGYDNGQADEGAALAFYGSSSGPGAAPNWLVEVNQAGAYFGFRVATAGDVNGDGFDDVIVGTEYYDNGTTDEGAVWVYHGSASGLSASPNWFAESNQGLSRFGGYSNNTAGDINGDGYSDIVVGAKQYDYACASEEEGAAYVWLGSASGLGANGYPGNADWKGCGNSWGHQYGASVGSAGDVNGDGYADLAVGCILCWIGADQGAIFLYYGSSAGLGDSGTPGNADWTGKIAAAGIDLGYAGGTAGDVNGDGYSDVFGGARYFESDQVDEGAAFVWYGSPDGLSTSANWRVESDQAGANLGGRAITAGDLNGDGFADVAIGAPNFDSGDVNEGIVLVYYGSALGLGENGTLANADWMAESNQDNAAFGYSLGAAGDVNGDGYGDLLVGAYLYDGGNVDEGAAFAWYGSPTGLGDNGTPSNADWVGEGGQDSARYAHIVNRAGDVNGDGFSDVIVGAYQYTNGQSSEGAVYVYHGSTSGLSAIENWKAESNLASSQFGVSASTAGDVNGDGFSDIIVGAWGYAEGQSGEGKAFVWLGSASGLGASGTPANADWSAASDQQDANFGRAVTTAGDVNGDGYSDIIVGALYYDNGQVNEGAVFVWHGSSAGLGANGTPANADWMAESNQSGSDFGLIVGNAGDVNDDGFTEVIVGARYYDNGEADEGKVFAWYGSSSGLGANGFPGNQDWTVESNQVNAHMGYGATGPAGDVNGDGFADLLVAVFDGGTSNEGVAVLFYGNKVAGLALAPQQMRSDGLAPVALLGASNSGTAIQLKVTGRMPLGRQRVRLEWQLAPLGVAFNDPGAIHGYSPSWTDSGISGAVLCETIGGLAPFTSYHWRIRLLYAPNRLGQVASRWLHIPWHSFAEKDFETLTARIYLPVAVRPE